MESGPPGEAVPSALTMITWRQMGGSSNPETKALVPCVVSKGPSSFADLARYLNLSPSLGCGFVQEKTMMFGSSGFGAAVRPSTSGTVPLSRGSAGDLLTSGVTGALGSSGAALATTSPTTTARASTVLPEMASQRFRLDRSCAGTPAGWCAGWGGWAGRCTVVSAA